MYTIIDNFLDKKEFNEIQEVILSNWFPWYKLDYKLNPDKKLSDGDEIYNLQFIHTFYKDYRPWSDFMTLLQPVTNKLDPLAYIRIKANLTTATKNKFIYGFHCDVENSNSTTAILYLNENDGGTIFENGQFVQSKENRLCLFESGIKHSATSHTDTKIRCVLNFNYISKITS
jgi:hypothetical protein